MLRSHILPDAIMGVRITVDITHESLPMQPAHCGFQRETIVQRLNWTDKSAECKYDQNNCTHSTYDLTDITLTLTLIFNISDKYWERLIN